MLVSGVLECTRLLFWSFATRFRGFHPEVSFRLKRNGENFEWTNLWTRFYGNLKNSHFSFLAAVVCSWELEHQKRYF